MEPEWLEDEEYWIEDDWYFAEIEAASIEPAGSCLISILPLIAVTITSCILAFLALNWTSPVVAISLQNNKSGNSFSDEVVETSAEQLVSESKPTKIAPLFTPEVRYWEDLIVKWADFYSIDPNLVATVMQIESCGDFAAESYAGARGLFQVMPYHFKSNEDPFDPDTNANRGMAYLQKAIQAQNEDSRLALASYNGGINGASRPESQWAAETQRYAYWGYGIYMDAVEGKKNSKRLQEWLNAGGAGLCAQASQRIGVTN